MDNPFDVLNNRLTSIEGILNEILSKPHVHINEQDELVNIEEAAQILNLSVPTLYGHVSKGTIPCMKKGKRLYFSKFELIDWVKSGRKNTLQQNNIEADNFLSQKKRR